MDHEEMNELPDGWVWTTIGEVAKVNPRDRAVRELPDDLQVSFVPMAAVDAASGTIAAPELRSLGQVRKGFTPFADGDVLIAKITPSMENGKAAVARNLVNGLGFGSTEFHVMRPLPAVLPEYIFQFIRQVSFREEAKANFAGTAGQLRVPSRFIQGHAFPLPPIGEQEGIIAKIEAVLTKLDAGVAGLKRVQAALKRYRAAVLKAACEGRLVPQDPNDEPAAKLLERILAERRAKWDADLRAKGKDPAKYEEPQAPDTAGLPALPGGWCWATVEQLGAVDQQPVLTGPFGMHLGREDFIELGVPVLTIGCLTEHGLDLERAFYVSEEKASELQRYRVKAGDILFSRMASVGRADLVSQSVDGALINYHLMRLRLADMAISPLYFIAFVRGSKEVANYIRNVNHGATRDGINTGQLLTMPVAVPPKRTQERIVAEVERRLSLVLQLDKTIVNCLMRAERLRQAILRRAFEGRLMS